MFSFRFRFVQTDRWTDGQTDNGKTIRPLIFGCWSIKDYNDILNETFPKQALVFTSLHYKSFENTVEKGEIARNEQFLLFPQCFLHLF